MYAEEGQYEQAVEITRQSLRLKSDPDNVNAYNNLPLYALALQRFDETRQIIRRGTSATKWILEPLHRALYALAFIGADSTAMAEQQRGMRAGPIMRASDSRLHPTPMRIEAIWARRKN